MTTLSIRCDQCGAPVTANIDSEPSECKSCGVTLKFHKNGSSIYSSAVQQIDQTTRLVAERLSWAKLFDDLIREDIRFRKEASKCSGSDCHAWQPVSGIEYWFWCFSIGVPLTVGGLLLIGINLFGDWPTGHSLHITEQMLCYLMGFSLLAGGVYFFKHEINKYSLVRIYRKFHEAYKLSLLLKYKVTRSRWLHDDEQHQTSENRDLQKFLCVYCGSELLGPRNASYLTCLQCGHSNELAKGQKTSRQSYQIAGRFQKFGDDFQELNEDRVWEMFQERDESLEDDDLSEPLSLKQVIPISAILLFVGIGVGSKRDGNSDFVRGAITAKWLFCWASVALFYFIVVVKSQHNALLEAYKNQKRKVRDVAPEQQLKAAVMSFLNRSQNELLQNSYVPESIELEDDKAWNTILKSIHKSLGPRPRFANETPEGESLSIARLIGSWSSDELNIFYDNYEDAFTEGQVVWGYVIQANVYSYSLIPGNTVAIVVYSPDFTRSVSPRILRAAYQKIFSSKRGPHNQQVRELFQQLSNPMSRFYDFRLPKKLTGGLQLAVSCLVMERRHLPNAVLGQDIVPLVVKPTDVKVPMIVPSGYWPQQLVEHWLMGKEMKTLGKDTIAHRLD